MKRLFKKSKTDSLLNLSYDFTMLYDKVNQHVSDIENLMKESIKTIEQINPNNIPIETKNLESFIDKIYRNALDAYSKINVSKDLSLENIDQLKLNKDKIKELNLQLKELYDELQDMKNKYENYNSDIEKLKDEVTKTKNLLRKMDDHTESSEKTSLLIQYRKKVIAKRKTIVENIHNGMMEDFNEIMRNSHKIEEIKENFKLKLEQHKQDGFEKLRDEFRKAFEDIYLDINISLDDIRDDMEIGLEINSKTIDNINENKKSIEELYNQLKKITEHLNKLKINNVELSDEYEILKLELSKLNKLMTS